MGANREPLVLEKLPESYDRPTAPGGQDLPVSPFSSWMEGRVSLIPTQRCVLEKGKDPGLTKSNCAHAPKRFPRLTWPFGPLEPDSHRLSSPSVNSQALTPTP